METHVVIIDTNHLIYKYYYSQHRLSFNGNDTTAQNGSLKSIMKWSNYGHNPTAVCFDRPVIARKAFFQDNFHEMVIGSGKEYKGNRERMPESMMEASKDIQRVLIDSGVAVYAVNGYEADDLIMACVKRARSIYKGLHIDIITNDADLLPLVDDDLSVFLRSMKGTYARDKSYEKAGYIEVTPDNYSTIVEGLSAYKGFHMPYNTLLLHKLLRGDSSDQFGCKDICRMFPASVWNRMMAAMEADGVDLKNSFRYGEPRSKILYRGDNREFNGTLEEALKSPDKGVLYQKILIPEEGQRILDLLGKYSNLSDEQLERVGKLYWGMNLNMTYPSARPGCSRLRYQITCKNDFGGFSEVKLKSTAEAAFGITKWY